MALKTFTLALALAGIAASVYASRRRGHTGRTTTLPSAGMGSSSAAEPLQQDKLAGQAGSGWAAGSEGGDLFSSSSQQSERPAGTGIPDFTRGA